jgi:hypothetical protein
MEHVEIGISFKFVKEVDCQLALSMGEGTHIAIVTHVNSVGIRLTKFDLVLLGMIEFFNSIMASDALVSKGAFVMRWAINHIGADFTRVGSKLSTSILLRFVIEKTFLGVVLMSYLALLSLEII